MSFSFSVVFRISAFIEPRLDILFRVEQQLVPSQNCLASVLRDADGLLLSHGHPTDKAEGLVITSFFYEISSKAAHEVRGSYLVSASALWLSRPIWEVPRAAVWPKIEGLGAAEASIAPPLKEDLGWQGEITRSLPPVCTFVRNQR